MRLSSSIPPPLYVPIAYVNTAYARLGFRSEVKGGWQQQNLGVSCVKSRNIEDAVEIQWPMMIGGYRFLGSALRCLNALFWSLAAKVGTQSR